MEGRVMGLLSGNCLRPMLPLNTLRALSIDQGLRVCADGVRSGAGALLEASDDGLQLRLRAGD